MWLKIIFAIAFAIAYLAEWDKISASNKVIFPIVAIGIFTWI